MTADKTIRYALLVYVGLAFLFIFTPIFASIVFSFNSDRFPSLPPRHTGSPRRCRP